MKKTLAFLLAASGMAMGEIVYQNDNITLEEGVTYQQFAFSPIGTADYTVAITLDLNNLAATPSLVNLFYTTGNNGTNAAISGMKLNSGDLGAYYTQSDSVENALAKTHNLDWDKTDTDDNITSGYQSLYNDPYINLSNAASVTLFLVSSLNEASTNSYTSLTGYAYIYDNDGGLVKYTGSRHFTYKPYTNISGVGVYAALVDKVFVYDSTLSATETENIAKSFAPSTPGDGNVPEPTTATLSLLALAGLAARRRR